jgi:hypothetical protein
VGSASVSPPVDSIASDLSIAGGADGMDFRDRFFVPLFAVLLVVRFAAFLVPFAALVARPFLVDFLVDFLAAFFVDFFAPPRLAAPFFVPLRALLRAPPDFLVPFLATIGSLLLIDQCVGAP